MSSMAPPPSGPAAHLLHALWRHERRGSPGQSLLDYVLHGYVDHPSLARLARVAWSMIEPCYAVIWRDVEIVVDGIYATWFHRHPTAAVTRGPFRFSQWHRSITALVLNGRWNAGWTRSIDIVDDPDVHPMITSHPTDISETYIQILDFIAQTTNLGSFRWSCPLLPIPTALLPLLATKTATLQRVSLQFDASGYLYHPLTIGDDGQPVSADEPQLTMSLVTEHAVWGPTAVAALPPLRLDVPKLRVTLQKAANDSVMTLLKLLDHRVVRVSVLNVAGVREHPTDLLPSYGPNGPPVNRRDFAINWRRNIPVRFLNCEYLSSELRLIGYALYPPSLTDLCLRNCTRMTDLLELVVRNAPALRAFGYYGLLETENVDQLNRGEHRHQFQKLERWDLLAVLDFVRQVQAPLEVLDLEGAFSDTLSVPYGDHLFAAVQAHLPTLRQLIVLDGERTEFGRLDLVEMAVCSTRLHDLRLRALAMDDDNDIDGLLEHLPEVLPLFKHLQCFLFLTSFPRSPEQSRREYDRAMAIIPHVARSIPLRLVGYEELRHVPPNPNIWEWEDDHDVEVVGHFHRVWQPFDFDWRQSGTDPIVSPAPLETVNYDAEHTRAMMSRLAVQLGIPQRNVAVTPWPTRPRPTTEAEVADVAASTAPAETPDSDPMDTDPTPAAVTDAHVFTATTDADAEEEL